MDEIELNGCMYEFMIAMLLPSCAGQQQQQAFTLATLKQGMAELKQAVAKREAEVAEQVRRVHDSSVKELELHKEQLEGMEWCVGSMLRTCDRLVRESSLVSS